MHNHDKTSRKIKMKKLITGVLLSACIATTAYAGGKNSDERRGGDFLPLHKMERVLDLTEEQKVQFQALKEELKAEREAKRAEMGEEGKRRKVNALAGLNPDDADYQEKVNTIAEQKAEKVKARFLKRAELRMKVADILTDEQLEKFDNMKKKRGKKQRHHS